jgi:hypothetical protein
MFTHMTNTRKFYDAISEFGADITLEHQENEEYFTFTVNVTKVNLQPTKMIKCVSKRHARTEMLAQEKAAEYFLGFTTAIRHYFNNQKRTTKTK